MKTTKPTQQASSPPGASGLHFSRTLYEILEEHLPGVHAQFPEMTNQISILLMQEPLQEEELINLMDTLSNHFTFNKHHLFTVISGMSFLVSTTKIQELHEADLFMDRHQESFYQILSNGIQRNTKDYATKPKVAKQSLT